MTEKGHWCGVVKCPKRRQKMFPYCIYAADNVKRTSTRCFTGHSDPEDGALFEEKALSISNHVSSLAPVLAEKVWAKPVRTKTADAV